MIPEYEKVEHDHTFEQIFELNSNVMKTMPIVESWLKDRFDDLWLPVSTRRQSDPEEILYITLLATAFNRKESEFYLSRIGSMLAFQTLLRGGLSVSNDQSLLEKAVPWFSQGHSLRTQAGVLFLEWSFPLESFLVSVPDNSYLGRFSPEELDSMPIWPFCSPRNSVRSFCSITTFTLVAVATA